MTSIYQKDIQVGVGAPGLGYGIKLIGNQWKPVGSETIKGELDKDGFKSFYTSTVEGWTASDVKIDENCNRIEIETSLGGVILGLTLTRK